MTIPKKKPIPHATRPSLGKIRPRLGPSARTGVFPLVSSAQKSDNSSAWWIVATRKVYLIVANKSIKRRPCGLKTRKPTMAHVYSRYKIGSVILVLGKTLLRKGPPTTTECQRILPAAPCIQFAERCGINSPIATQSPGLRKIVAYP